MTEDPVARTARSYDNVAGVYLARNRDRSLVTERIDRFAARLPNGSLVADLGAGPGFDAAEFRSRGLRAVSLDYSFEMLRAGAGEYPGPCVQADMRRLPFRDHALDGVWASASLVHLPHQDALSAMREMHRALRRGGLAYMSVRSGAGGEWETVRLGVPRWLEYWSATDLDAALTRIGFAIRESYVNETAAGSWLVRVAISAS